MIISVNIQSLEREMTYEPLWLEDKYILMQMLYLPIISQKQLIDLARLYIRYKHRLYRDEIKLIFKILLKKSKYSSFHQLNTETQKMYIP